MNIDINAAIQRMNKEQEQDKEKMQGIKTLLGQLERVNENDRIRKNKQEFKGMC